MEMKKKKKQWVRLLHPRSSRKATGGFEKKIKKKISCARQKLEWLLPISSTGALPRFEVMTGR